MFERFTERGRAVMVLAADEARALGHGHIGTEHLVLALARESNGLAARALGSMGIAPDALRAKALELAAPPSAGPPVERPPFTPGAKKALELSLREALQFGHNYIGTEHLLLGVLREGSGIGAQALTALGAGLEPTRTRVGQLLAGYGTPRVTAKGRPTSAVAVAMGKAKDLAGEGPVTTAHLLGALADDPHSQAAWALTELGVAPDALRGALAAAPLEGTSDAPPRPKTVEVKLGETSTVIDDAELAGALSRMNREQLLDALRKVTIPPLEVTREPGQADDNPE